MKPIFDNFQLLNVPRTTAKVLEVLSDGKEHTLREIERVADLRQPEVSIAVEQISSYVTITKLNPEFGRGRPQKVVQMSKRAYGEYIDACVKCYEAALEVARDAARELKGE